MEADKRAEFIDKQLLGEDDIKAADIKHKILNIFDSYPQIFADNSKGEVPIMAKMEDGSVISGVIDRLVIGEDKVEIIDFKTGSKTQSDKYQKQIDLYIEAVEKIYPERKVVGRLIWV